MKNFQQIFNLLPEKIAAETQINEAPALIGELDSDMSMFYDQYEQ